MPLEINGGVRPPRLLDRVREANRLRHGSRSTEKSYIAWIRRYILFHGKRHPAEMGAPEVAQFPSFLAVDAATFPSFLQQDLPWLEDVVRARRPKDLPVVLTRDEVRAVISKLQGMPRLMATLLYGSGLRVLECARLRVQDVDFAMNQIVVRDGKGAKDRVTVLPAVAKQPLAQHLSRVKRLHDRDVALGGGWVELPWALPANTPTPGENGRGSGSSRRHDSTSTRPQGSGVAITFTRPSCSAPCSRPCDRQSSASVLPRIRFGTRSPLTC